LLPKNFFCAAQAPNQIKKLLGHLDLESQALSPQAPALVLVLGVQAKLLFPPAAPAMAMHLGKKDKRMRNANKKKNARDN
jgi:hypothetical protein